MGQSNVKMEFIFPTHRDVLKEAFVTSRAGLDANKDINEEGLFSQSIFGVIGSSDRFALLGAIDLGKPILHPRVAIYLEEIDSLYRSVWEGKVKAKLVKSALVADEGGETGYRFFLSILDKIKFPHKDSDERQQGSEIVQRYRKAGKLTNDVLIVIPAGIRDFNIEDGVLKYDEINDLYIAAMAAADMLVIVDSDDVRLKVHNKIMDIYKHIMSMLSGKKKYINKHFMSRNYMYGSRNVISGQVLLYDNINDMPIDIIDYFEIGLNQYLKNIEPVVVHYVDKLFYKDNIISGALFKDKEVTRESVSDKELRMFSKDNIPKLIEKFQNPAFRHRPVMVGDRYLGYVSATENTRTIYLPDSNVLIPDDAEPLTYGEMFYSAIAHKVEELGLYSTRYPVAYTNSMVVGKVKLFSTVEKVSAKPITVTIASDFSPTIFENIEHFPERGGDWRESFVVSFVRLTEFGADFDGDGMSSGNTMSDEANTEIRDKLNSIGYYKEFNLDISDKPAEFVALTLTMR